MSVAGDRALTANRAEHKYLVHTGQVPGLLAVLDRALYRHHHAADSPVAGMTQHFTTTVYFDTSGRELYSAARRRADHTKLRAREYYDVLPLAELATNEEELLRSSPILWLELKDRSGDQTGKRRAGVPKRRLHEFLAHRKSDPELRAIQTETYGEQGEDVLARVVDFLESYEEPLQPSCIVNYRRTAWQNAEGSVRVTLDEDLCTFAPRDALWQQERTLTRSALGHPTSLSHDAIVEVKRLGNFPEWLANALSTAEARPSHVSKFVLASAALYGDPDGLPSASTPPCRIDGRA